MTERLQEIEKELKAQILTELDFSDEPGDERVLDVIDGVLKRAAVVYGISLARRCELRREFFDSIRRLDLLQQLLEQPEITEIMINGESGIFVEKNGCLEAFDGGEILGERLEELVMKITGRNNRMVNEASPLTDVRLEDGSRVHIAVAPVALNGPVITIRRFPEHPVTLKDLLQKQSLNEEIAAFLRRAVEAKYNIFVSGATGAGKTTLLNVLSDFIPKNERIITIEDTAELQIRNVPNLVRLEARAAVDGGCKEITIRDLLRASLRMRPDRIIVGEVRGGETVDMLQAFTTGHEGSLSTGHGNSTKDMLYRLETMALMGMELPAEAIRRQLASGIDLMIHLGRLRDRRRVLLEISEIDGCENGEIVLNEIYRFCEDGTQADGTIRGRWEKTGSLRHREKLRKAGME